MANPLTSISARVRAALLCALLACTLAAAVGARDARAEQAQFCNVTLGANLDCRGPLTIGLKWVDAEEWTRNTPAICTTAEAWDGSKFYILFGWSCAQGAVYYQLPTSTNGYPAIGNPNSRSQTDRGLRLWN